MENINILNEVYTTIDENTQNFENFLSVQDHLANQFRQTTKCLYDFTKLNSNHKNNALPELVIQDFDEEQIWQQIEIQNESELTHFLTEVSRVLSKKSDLTLPVSLTKSEDTVLDDEANTEEKEHESEKEENAQDDESNSDDDMDFDFGLDEIQQKDKTKPKSSKRHKKSSIVDDKFFKLTDLDEYLNREDQKQSKTADDESDEESVDLFRDDSEDDDNGRTLKYTDFFDSPDSEDENVSEKEKDKNEEDNCSENNSDEDYESDKNDENNERMKKKIRKAESTSDLNNSDNDESDDRRNEIKSTLENRQERLKKRIEELENEAISDKPWQLKGEVSATGRPQNSLLEEYVEFDVTTRPAPIITEETTLRLEDIIMQRIKDRAWDDVEKKFKPVETPMEYKKKLIMDQEKSKKSLAEIYEEAYLKQKEALNPENQEKEEEEPEEHKEIRGMMNSLFQKLDALSNFHYTPKMAQPEVKIISNVPAFTMEEVAPVATADAALLAPEEIQAKHRGDLIGKSERTKTDMKRERRKKKSLQRKRFKAKEQKENSTLSDKLKKNKKQMQEAQSSMLKKLTKDRNIKKVDETNHKAIKSSTAFFTQLQDEVTELIKSKTQKVKNKKEKVNKSAVKLKL
ncbi:U3 small nucleolar ribonucleoprotein protein MPP10 [Chelonus insularis]|uniref:U3 small nucleolar ribonucleoprotein protein MPP10 n=1 Tax=Chelonus insularis TaxID=460826 RepID=UPI00158A1034|nr:U3 small nucleolar ribonucleoprotein protein MPP10 [Chelonus insularis]